MQYLTTCLDEDCPYRFADPTEKSALSRLREHIEETGHDVALQGKYDNPSQGGVHGPGGHREFAPEDFAPYGPL